MVQINISTAFVVSIVAASVLAAPILDSENGSIARREPKNGAKSKAVQQKINDAVRVQETKLKGKERTTRKDELQAEDKLASDIMRGDFNAAKADNTRVQKDKGDIRTLRGQEAQVASYARPVKREPAPGDEDRAAQQKINNAVRVQEGKLKGQERNTRKDELQAEDRLAGDITRGDFNAAQKDNARIQTDEGNIRNLRKQEAQIASYARPVGKSKSASGGAKPKTNKAVPKQKTQVARKPASKAKSAPGDKSRKAQQKINDAVRVQEGKLKTQERNTRKDEFRAQNAQINDLIKGDFKGAQTEGARVQKDSSTIKDLRSKEAQVASYAKPVRRSFDDFELEERDLDEYDQLEARSFDDYELEERGFDEMDLDMLD